jgi:hypothetical protein
MLARLLRTRRIRRLRRFLSPDGFAMAPVWLQLATIFLASAAIIFLLAPFIGSLSASYRLFADPSSYADMAGGLQLAAGLLQVLLGLILFSFIISVLSAALEQLIERIKGGSLPCRKKGHILIVNYNAKLPLILDEINVRAERQAQVEDIVLLFPTREIVDLFLGQLDPVRWPHLEIYVRQGDPLAYDTFRPLGILDASGVVILAPDGIPDTLARDNACLKILTALVNAREFFDRLVARQRARDPVKCSIELSNRTYSREIARALTRDQNEALFAIISPGDVIGSVLSRSIIDIAYYQLYYEIISYHGHTAEFVDPARFPGLAAGVSYEQLVLGFSGGILAGFSRTDASGQLQVRLCPFGENLQDTDWLLFITRDAQSLAYTPQPPAKLKPTVAIKPPSEILSRRLCLVGSAWPVDNLGNFLDDESRGFLRASHFVFDQVDEYFRPEFVARLRSVGYDNIIINLDDDAGFRLTLFLITGCDDRDPFLEKIVTVLSDPVLEGLLNQNPKYRNQVLSHKLAACYIAQLSFQKNLEKFFNELAFPEGSEFNLLEVDTHIPRKLLTTPAELQRHLLSHQLVYVGIVDAAREIHLEAESLAEARQVVVLGHGEV